MSEGAASDGDAFSLIRGDWPFRVQRALGLIPADGGLGVARRVLLLILLTWVPIVVWASLTERALPGHVSEPLFAHFGVHTRCLVGIPLFIVAEATMHAVSRRLIPYFASSGLVTREERPRFLAILAGVAAWRDRSLPWVLIVGLVVGWTIVRPLSADVHELVWATEHATQERSLGFGGWWFLFVARPVFTALLLGFLWRIGLLGLLLRRIAALPLSLVPTHPDRTGGLAFLEYLPLAVSPGILAVSAVLASRWAHDVAYHGVELPSLAMPAALLLVMLAVVALAPLTAFSGCLRRARLGGLLDYGAVVGEHGRRVRRKWILGETVEDRESLLSAPELGPVADTVALYEAVGRMRTVPIGTQALAGVLVPAILPLVAVAAIRIPLKDMVLTIVKAVL
jgi:hypothetical protein